MTENNVVDSGCKDAVVGLYAPIVGGYPPFMADTLVRDLESLRHMLGFDTNGSKGQWGYRNYFRADPGSEDHAAMLRLAAMNFVVPGAGGMYHATKLGCQVVGLPEKLAARAVGLR